MATTIAHPRSIPSGPSGKTVAGFLVGVLVALGVGYGITNVTDTVDAASSSALGADRVLVQRGADLAAQQAAALSETKRMIAANENWSSFQSPMDAADLVIVQKAADYAALQTRGTEGADLVIMQKAADYAALQARVAGAGFSSDGASHALPEYIRAELAKQSQNAQLDSQIEFLTEQWKARQPEPQTSGPLE